jgi:hypothetical protein
MPSINNFLSGFSDGLPGMKDYAHASRLYVDDNFKLMPKQKFMFHVVITVDDDKFTRKLTTNEKYELNMLVKSCSLPKFNFNIEEKFSYNKKVYIPTRLSYEPINITFHDDHADTVNAFWKAYYEYNIQDTLGMNLSTPGMDIKDDYYNPTRTKSQYGLDGAQKRGEPLIKSIQIFALHKKRFTSFTLVNPVITTFAHDDLDQTDGGGLMANTMQVVYETVLYSAGIIRKNAQPAGFATIHYDLAPSPLSVLGGGTTSIFGPGGIVDGIGSVIGDIQSGNFGVGTILKGINTYNNAKKIKAKDAVKEELKGIVKQGVIDIGKQAGTITNPVGEFSIGNAVTAAAVAGAAIATSRGIDNIANKNRNTVVQGYVVDTANYLSPTEAYNLILNNTTLRDQVAASIYYKTVGSRQGDTVAESDVKYAALTTNQKFVYQSRAQTDIAKLVTEGYIRIKRDTKDVLVSAERANL